MYLCALILSPAAENLVLMGGHGTGKSHMAVVLAVEACKGGKKVRFYIVTDLVHHLLEAKDAQSVLKLQQNLAKLDLLILDELGRADCKQDGGNLLFQVISFLCERGLTIITTNLEFKEWISIFGTQQLTNAFRDRLTHQWHIIPLNGDSYMLKESLKRQKTNAGKSMKVKEHAKGK